MRRGELPDTELPTLEGLEELKRQKLITGDQQIQLGKMIVALDEPETSPVDGSCGLGLPYIMVSNMGLLTPTMSWHGHLIGVVC